MAKKNIPASVEQELIDNLKTIAEAEKESFVTVVTRALEEFVSRYFDKLKR